MTTAPPGSVRAAGKELWVTTVPPPGSVTTAGGSGVKGMIEEPITTAVCTRSKGDGCAGYCDYWTAGN